MAYTYVCTYDKSSWPQEMIAGSLRRSDEYIVEKMTDFAPLRNDLLLRTAKGMLLMQNSRNYLRKL